MGVGIPWLQLRIMIQRSISKVGKMGPEKEVLEEKVGNEVSPLEECIDCWWICCWMVLVSSEEPVAAR